MQYFIVFKAFKALSY